MLAYTGIETVSNLAEEARDPVRTSPRRSGSSRSRSSPSTSRSPPIALSALPVELVDGEYQTLLGLPPEEGGFANDPVLGVVAEPRHLGRASAHALEIYVGVLAATILFIATNAGVIGASRDHVLDGELPAAAGGLPPAAPPLQHAVGRRSLVFAGLAPLIVILPGRDELPRDDLLVRRDALVHRRARLDHQRCASRPAGRGSRVSRPAEPPGAGDRLAALRAHRR